MKLENIGLGNTQVVGLKRRHIIRFSIYTIFSA